MQKTFRIIFSAFFVLVAVMGAAYSEVPNEQEMELERVKDRMTNMEKQISNMQRELYRGGKSSSKRSVSEEPIGSEDERMRAINGKIEEVEHSISVLAQKLDKIIADIDFRIAALEKKGEVVAEAANPAQTSDAAPTQTADAQSTATPEEPVDLREVAAIRYDQAIELIKREKYAEAEASFKTFIASNKDSDLLGNAYYWLAETYYIRKNYTQASVYFLKGYKDFPKGNKAADNLLKLAMSLKALDKNKEACATLDKMKKEFPKGDKDLLARADKEKKSLKCQ